MCRTLSNVTFINLPFTFDSIPHWFLQCVLIVVFLLLKDGRNIIFCYYPTKERTPHLLQYTTIWQRGNLNWFSWLISWYWRGWCIKLHFFLDEYTKPNVAVLREAMKQCLQQMTEIYSMQIDFVRVYVCMFKRQQLFSSSFERTVNNNFHLNKTTSIISKTCYRTSISFPSFPHLYQKNPHI